MLKEVEERRETQFQKWMYTTINPPVYVAERQTHLLNRIGDGKCDGQSYFAIAWTQEREQCIQSARLRLRQLIETIICKAQLQDEIFDLVDRTVAECPKAQELLARMRERVTLCDN